MQTLRKISIYIDKLNGGVGHVIRWLVLIMVLLGAYNALARYATQFAGTSLISNALTEGQWYLFSAIFLMGSAYGLDRDVHVRVDVMYNAISDKGRAWIDLAGTVLFLLPFSALMLSVSWPVVRRSWAVREMSGDPGGLPRYPIMTLILVSFGLLMLQGFSQLIKQVVILQGGEPPEGVVEDLAEEYDARHGEGV